MGQSFYSVRSATRDEIKSGNSVCSARECGGGFVNPIMIVVHESSPRVEWRLRIWFRILLPGGMARPRRVDRSRGNLIPRLHIDTPVRCGTVGHDGTWRTLDGANNISLLFYKRRSNDAFYYKNKIIKCNNFISTRYTYVIIMAAYKHY